MRLTTPCSVPLKKTCLILNFSTPYSAKRGRCLMPFSKPNVSAITGTVAAPALPGPSDLHVAYIDEPKGYTYKPIASALRVLRIDVARVRIEGSVSVEDLSVEIEIEAALVT